MKDVDKFVDTYGAISNYTNIITLYEERYFNISPFISRNSTSLQLKSYDKPFTGIMQHKVLNSNTLVFSFYKNGYLHRLNGPCVLTYRLWSLTNDSKPISVQWRLYHRFVEPEILIDFYELHGIDISNITPEDELLIYIHFGIKKHNEQII